jgi:hypothetical protein
VEEVVEEREVLRCNPFLSSPSPPPPGLKRETTAFGKKTKWGEMEEEGIEDWRSGTGGGGQFVVSSIF